MDRNIGSRIAAATLRDLGPKIGPLIAGENVTDVLFNSSRQAWIDRGHGLEQILSPYRDDDELHAELVRLAAIARRRIDNNQPIADGVIGNIRFHAVIPPLADGPTLSLRFLGQQQLQYADLIASGTLVEPLAGTVRALVEKGANCLIAGATGSGKTTLLNAILGLVPSDQRIVCIEEVSELAPPHPHVVSLRERQANLQGKGSVTMAQLVQAAMRMRPDRIVIGECRGGEVTQMLAAMNTGHNGCWATLHANSMTSVPARIVALEALAGQSPATIAAQANAALDAVLHIRRVDGKRWVSGIGALNPEAWRIEPALIRSDSGCSKGPGWARIERRIQCA